MLKLQPSHKHESKSGMKVANCKFRIFSFMLSIIALQPCVTLANFVIPAAGIWGKKEGKPVKFSTDKDIPKPECNKLLLTEMSKQIKNSKIIQKLYIRYLH